jgi:hypothetical protein
LKTSQERRKREAQHLNDHSPQARYEVTEYTGSTVQTGSQAAEVFPESTGRLSDQARRAGASVQDQVRRQLGDRTTAAGEQAAAIGRAMRDMSGHLRSQGNDGAAWVTEETAERAERLGRYMRDADGGRILADVEDFGRRQPWLIAALGVTAGVVAARFLKASSRRRGQRQGTAYGEETAAQSRVAAPAAWGNAPTPAEEDPEAVMPEAPA